MNNKLQQDIQDYISARNVCEALYATIGSDRARAEQMRPNRWAANTSKREAAENLVMSVIGNHKPALRSAGLLEMYEDFAAGKGSLSVLFAVADQTAISLKI